ncbi:5-oxoprolinase subunit B family protein [Paragemmobacter ruber]|uniref:Carboxyltransferase domain-containing protein n=1 Tax=Paragemmobacter ruber TaxID=1985673 RepID=A0ABW9Y210_9RHOB|nr:allophanate hydrolase subunit 1 [Rhodobacter ruber]NBE06176.1 carboxyltransferase domain-containing protein [Rhodobacter ruber]
MTPPRLTPVAERAVLVEFGTVVDAAVHAAVLALDRALGADPVPGQVEVVPAMVNLLVVFDPLVTDHAAVRAALASRLADLVPEAGQGAVHEVPVCYDGAFGRDLAAVAAQAGCSVEAVIAAHLAGEYHVAMYGFAPGYAYLTGVPEPIRLPRKPAPVRGVPAGSVIIAAGQCLVTTLTMPTGWWVIGRSPTPILTGDPARPFLFAVGDRVRFRRVGVDALAGTQSGALPAPGGA